MTSNKDKIESPVKELKNILILMPFQSGSPIGEKTSFLEKTRIKYIVEDLIEIKSKAYPGISIKYQANIVNTGVGEIENLVEQEFEKTDLFIALLSKSNVNVIFEVAILNVLQQNLLLLKDSEVEPQDIPVYFSGYAFIEFYPGEDGEEIRRLIKKLASDSKFKIHRPDEYSKSEVDAYKEKIKELDAQLIDNLQENIIKYEDGDVTPPLAFRKLVRDVHPQNALSTWNTLLPMCVLKAKWMPTIPGKTQYDGVDSLIEPIYAASCNASFLRIMGSANNNPSDFLEGNFPLTGSAQMDMLQPYMSKENFAVFEQDQINVFEQLFIQDKPVKAVVPIEFKNGTQEHPYPEFKDKVFLPILLAKKVVGVRSSPHTTFYIIAYVEDFFPFDGNTSKKKT